MKRPKNKKPPLSVPYSSLTPVEGLGLGLRMNHVTTEHGGIYSGAGLGSPWIPLVWRGRYASIHAVELLAAWVETFNPEDAAALRASIENRK